MEDLLIVPEKPSEDMADELEEDSSELEDSTALITQHIIALMDVPQTTSSSISTA
jgi:predicted glycosyltransferase